MRKERIIILFVLIGGLILFSKGSNLPGVSVNSSLTPFPTISQKMDSTEFISFAPTSSRNIEVLSPHVGDKVKSGFWVKGNARTFESNVAIRLYDSEGNVLTETFTLANAPDVGQFGPFEKIINFETGSDTGTLEVFQYSAKDGSQIDKVTIPLAFE